MEIQTLFTNSWAPSHAKWVAKKVHFSISASSDTKKYQKPIKRKLKINLCPAAFVLTNPVFTVVNCKCDI